VSARTRTFSTKLYPRSALEAAVLSFQGICEVRLAEEPTGICATFELPTGATETVIDEFCNVALIASVEAQLGTRP
jgi:hypothetical protein